MADGVLSKGIKLYYGVASTSQGTTTINYTELHDCQGIPSLGGKADSVETTSLEDIAHTFISGLISYGDSLDFNFIFDPTRKAQLTTLDGFGDATKYWKAEFPPFTEDTSVEPHVFTPTLTATWQGKCSVSLDAVGTNAPIKYTLSVKPTTAITIA